MKDSTPVVAFDLGGVLLDWHPRYLYRKLFPGNEAAMERFLAEICTPAWNGRQDAGRPWAQAVAELSAAHPAERDLIAAYSDRWPEMMGGAIDGTVRVLEELRAAGHVRLFALSNWSAEKFLQVRGQYEFLSWFESIVLSGEIGVNKPDPAFFRHFLERHRIVPGSVVFIDDTPANIEAAERAGMRGIRFTAPGALRSDLVALGLLSPLDGPGHP